MIPPPSFILPKPTAVPNAKTIEKETAVTSDRNRRFPW